MCRLLGLTFAWLSVGLNPVFAESPADIPGLIAKLGDPNFRVRTEAGRKLQGLGFDALPALREARSHANPEVRHRAAALAERMSRDLLLGPTRVTLRVADRPVEEVVELLGEQTGYELKAYVDSSEARKLTLDLKDVTFWEAIDEVSLRAGMTYYADGGDDSGFLREQDTYSPYVHHHGPFRLSLLSIDSHRSVQLAHVPRDGDPFGQNNGSLSLSFGILSERKVPMLRVGQAELTEAIDQNGLSLLPPRDEGSSYSESYYYGGHYRSFEQHTQAMLRKAHRGSVKVKRLKGTVRVTLLAEERPDIVVKDIVKLKKDDFTGHSGTLRLERLEDPAGDGDGLTLAMSATFPPTDYGGNDFHQRMFVVDAEGNRYRTEYSEMESGGDYMRATATFVAPDGEKYGPPDRFVVYRWITIDHTVPFEFGEVPLP